jgi:hypothetical protein
VKNWRKRKEIEMEVVFSILVVVFVVSVLGVAGYALFKMSPMATHAERFRDPRTGKRLTDSPHLDG